MITLKGSFWIPFFDEASNLFFFRENSFHKVDGFQNPKILKPPNFPFPKPIVKNWQMVHSDHLLTFSLKEYNNPLTAGEIAQIRATQNPPPTANAIYAHTIPFIASTSNIIHLPLKRTFFTNSSLKIHQKFP